MLAETSATLDCGTVKGEVPVPPRGEPESSAFVLLSLRRVVGFPSPLLIVVVALTLGSVSRLSGAEPSGGTLRGTTTAGGSHDALVPVEGVSLRLSGASPALPDPASLSDHEGNYEFLDLAPGSYTLEATLEGFKPVVKKVTIVTRQTVVENIALELEDLHQQLEVRGQADTISTETVAPTSNLSAPQLMALPTAQQKFKQALPLVPGVVRTADGKISIKGSVEDQGMLRVDSAESVDPVTGSFAIDLSIDAIQSLSVSKTPYGAENGGFSGGLTSIQTKPPSGKWRYGLSDFLPRLRGKQGHIVGVSDSEPRFSFSGPLWASKLSVTESFIYNLRKQPVRGLAWPDNETKRQGFNSFTSLQYLFSPRHLTTMSVQMFPQRTQFADINSLVPQSASSDLGHSGFSVGAIDHYVLASGGVLTTLYKHTQFSSYAHGQGPEEMLITPNGWGGNFFNAWTRASGQEEALQTFQLPRKQWRGSHDLEVGADLIHRSFDGASLSRPVRLLRQDGSLAERIDFLSPVPSLPVRGSTPQSARSTEVGAFVQDHWALNDQVALDAGLRYFGQTLGRPADFAPRLGVVFSPGQAGKTVFRGGAGVFHDRVSLLAAGFNQNPTRVVSLFDPQGVSLGSPQPFRNACGKASATGLRIVPSCADFGDTSRNITWNVEVERSLLQHVTLRVGYLSSRAYGLPVVNPARLPGLDPLLLLTNTGASRYHEVEVALRLHPTEQSEVNVSYLHSRSRGDLNTLSAVLIPFEQPVIRPNAYASLSSDVPDRLVSWGIFKFPRRIVLSPVVDYRSGLRYSNVDELQNYLLRPNRARFPNFFSVDVEVSREFDLPSFVRVLKGHRFRVSFMTSNLTNHTNPLDVFNEVTSPNFGHFVGFQHRVTAIGINIVN